jgi:hypothetical protein
MRHAEFVGIADEGEVRKGVPGFCPLDGFCEVGDAETGNDADNDHDDHYFDHSKAVTEGFYPHNLII